MTPQKNIKCTVCKRELPKEMMSIECPDCYLKGCNKEIAKATKTERQRVLGILDDYYSKSPSKKCKILINKLKEKIGEGK